MKKFLSFLFGIILILSLKSCIGGRPLASAPSDTNKTYQIDYLFEHEGCKVYRFMDMGNYIYFTNCTGSVTSVESDSIKTQRRTIIYRETLPSNR